MIIGHVPDLHFPYHHRHTFDFIRDLKKEYKPDLWVLAGDELELAGLSFNHDKNPNMPGASDEFELGKKYLKTLYKILPEADVCTSNHTSRGFRSAFKFGIPSQFLRDYRDLLEAPRGWRWRDSFEHDKVLYIHGEGFSGKLAHVKAAMDHRQSVAIGHIHAWAGVQYIKSRQGQIFGLNSGCLIDADALAFRWAKNFATKPILGASIIEDGKKAHFIPMKV